MLGVLEQLNDFLASQYGCPKMLSDMKKLVEINEELKQENRCLKKRLYDIKYSFDVLNKTVYMPYSVFKYTNPNILLDEKAYMNLFWNSSPLPINIKQDMKKTMYYES